MIMDMIFMAKNFVTYSRISLNDSFFLIYIHIYMYLKKPLFIVNLLSVKSGRYNI